MKGKKNITREIQTWLPHFRENNKGENDKNNKNRAEKK